ncbi:MAG: putative transporter [Candidatus Marinimicrobia bacterium]|nr:putative transporter [Candidatus Neomarinimicrobiota bacterium]
MIKSFFWSKKWALWAWGGVALLLVSLYAQVYMSVLFNEWYGQFYNMLQSVEKHTLQEFEKSLWYFTKIAMVAVVVGTFTSWFTRKYSLAWREAMTFDYIPRWINITSDIEGSSQRIQEDAYRWARIVESLGLQVVRAVMTLVAFLPILWHLGVGLNVPLIGDGPGNLVWAALIVSLGGMVISWFVGIKLPGLEYNNQKVEAAFRKELVFGEDHGESHFRKNIPTLTEMFVGIKFNYNRLFLHYGYFDFWVYAYDQFMVIVPYLIAGPALFSTAITLGVVVQISNAFQKVHGSFSLFIHNWTTITELRSIWKRLHEFESNLEECKTCDEEKEI